MTEALTGPTAVAAIVLMVAGAAKLRSLTSAVRALRDIGLPVLPRYVRVAAGAELGLGAWYLLAPGWAPAAALAGGYASFTALGVLLARRRAPCGCFGDGGAPASAGQVALSAALALACLAAAHWHPHGLGWILGRSPVFAAGLVVGIGGCVYATTLAYKELPSGWAGGGSR